MTPGESLLIVCCPKCNKPATLQHSGETELFVEDNKAFIVFECARCHTVLKGILGTIYAAEPEPEEPTHA